MQILRNGPIHPNGFPNLTGNPANAPRCGAYARTTGNPCRSPAVRGKKRCRMHGGAKGSGGQPGNKNRLTWGHYTAEGRAGELLGGVMGYWITGDRRRIKRVVRDEAEAQEVLKLFTVVFGAEMTKALADEWQWHMDMPTDTWKLKSKNATV